MDSDIAVKNQGFLTAQIRPDILTFGQSIFASKSEGRNDTMSRQAPIFKKLQLILAGCRCYQLYRWAHYI